MNSLRNLYEAAGDIRQLLMPFAFLLCVIGIGEMAWRAGSDTRAILGTLIKTIIIVGLIAGYPAVMGYWVWSFFFKSNSVSTENATRRSKRHRLCR